MTESKSPDAKEVWITGIGIVSSLGEGLDAHWDALNAKRINVDEKRFAPYIVHPLAPVSFDAQIPKKGDQRQMEAWQRIGTYAAGLALDSAGVKGNQEILSRMDMVIAAGGGERDIAVDMAILNADAQGNSSPGFLNERLMNDLRPTLFLAQLSNLLAGNIAIVHGVCGTSRTFMGEEAASIDAARIALARIEAGQSDIALIGAAHNGERPDLLILYEFGDFNLTDKFSPVWARENNSGFAMGSVGAFLVMESQRTRRGARRKTLRQADQGGRRSRAAQAAGRGDEIAGSAVAEARRPQRQWQPYHRGDRRRAGDVGRESLPAPASRLRRARDRHDVRPHAGHPVSARAWRSPHFRSRAARCFRPTIRPGSRLKSPNRRPRLSSWGPVTGRAKAWPWSRLSSRA